MRIVTGEKLAALLLALTLTAALMTRALRRLRHSAPRRPASQPLPLWAQPAPGVSPPPPGTLETERRLRIAPSLRRLILILTLVLLLTLTQLALHPPGLLFWTAMALLAILLWQSLLAQSWELRFDSVGLSVPQGFRRRRGHLWREVTAVERDDPLSLILHFTDGTALHIPNHIEGREDLLQIADHWIKAAEGSARHAGTARS